MLIEPRVGRENCRADIERFVKLWLYERFRREIVEARLMQAESPDMRRFKRQLNAAARNLRRAKALLAGHNVQRDSIHQQGYQ